MCFSNSILFWWISVISLNFCCLIAIAFMKHFKAIWKSPHQRYIIKSLSWKPLSAQHQQWHRHSKNFIFLLHPIHLDIISFVSYLTSISLWYKPGNLASLWERSIITMFIHLAETIKQIFVSISRYWWKQDVNDAI